MAPHTARRYDSRASEIATASGRSPISMESRSPARTSNNGSLTRLLKSRVTPPGRHNRCGSADNVALPAIYKYDVIGFAQSGEDTRLVSS